MLALQGVRAQLDPSEISGTVIIVQIANVPSFQQRTIYRGPWDQKNLNRVYPGRPDGTTSERIAHAITTQVIDRCTHLVDMHSGDGNEALRPYSYWNHLGMDERVDTVAREMALAFGIDHIVIDRGRPRIHFPWPLVFGMRFCDLAPAMIGDRILRDFRFRIRSA